MYLFVCLRLIYYHYVICLSNGTVDGKTFQSFDISTLHLHHLISLFETSKDWIILPYTIHNLPYISNWIHSLNCPFRCYIYWKVFHVRLLQQQTNYTISHQYQIHVRGNIFHLRYTETRHLTFTFFRGEGSVLAVKQGAQQKELASREWVCAIRSVSLAFGHLKVTSHRINVSWMISLVAHLFRCHNSALWNKNGIVRSNRIENRFTWNISRCRAPGACGMFVLNWWKFNACKRRNEATWNGNYTTAIYEQNLLWGEGAFEHHP